jgi:DNA-binding NtrC family response regulator
VTRITSQTIPVLSVTPFEGNHRQLERALGPGYHVCTASTTAGAIFILKQQVVPVLVCESDLESGSWKDLLGRFAELGQAPQLIVTSRLADDSLWAEALNLGAYDVLAQPFDAEEVSRVVHSAWRQWTHRGTALPAMRTLTAGGY